MEGNFYIAYLTICAMTLCVTIMTVEPTTPGLDRKLQTWKRNLTDDVFQPIKYRYLKLIQERSLLKDFKRKLPVVDAFFGSDPFQKDKRIGAYMSLTKRKKRAVTQDPNAFGMRYPRGAIPLEGNLPFGVIIADNYTFPDTKKISEYYLTIKMRTYKSCSTDTSPDCLEILIPDGDFGAYSVSVKTYPMRKNQGDSTCEDPNDRKEKPTAAAVGEDIVDFSGTGDVPVDDDNNDDISCGLAYKRLSEAFGHIYIKEDYCPNKITHFCRIDIRISKLNTTISKIYTTYILLVDVNEQPVCPKSVTITHAEMWKEIKCEDRDEMLMSKCGALGCISYTENSFVINRSISPVRYTNQENGISLWVPKGTKPFNNTYVDVNPGSHQSIQIIYDPREDNDHSAERLSANDFPVPFIVATAPTIAYEGESLTLMCRLSQQENVSPKIQWYKDNKKLPGEEPSLSFNDLTFEDDGSYSCQNSNDANNGQFSDSLRIIVYRQGSKIDLESSKMTGSYIEINNVPEFGPLKDFDLRILQVYIENAIKRSLVDYPNVIEVKVHLTGTRNSFNEGGQMLGQLAYNYDLELKERWLPGKGIKSHRPRAIDFIKAENSALKVTLPIDINRMVVKPISAFEEIVSDFREGQKLNISCVFQVLFEFLSDKPYITTKWQFQGDVLDTESAVFRKEKQETVLSSRRLNLKLLIINSILKITHFSMNMAGEFRCNLHSINPRPEGTAIRLISIVQSRPAVYMSPLRASVMENSSLNFVCRFSNIDKFELSQGNETFVSISTIAKNYTVNWTVKEISETTSISCIAHLGVFTDRKELNIDINPIPKDGERTLFCDRNEDRKGTIWSKTPNGIQVSSSCPTQYSGKVTRVCSQSGDWEPARYANCRRKDLDQIEKQVQNMKSEELSAKDVEEIAGKLSSSVNTSESLLPNDISRVVNIIVDIGDVVDSSSDDDQESLISNAALEEVASVTDQVLSADERDWEEATETDNSTESGKSENVKGVKTPGTRLILAIGHLVSSSLAGQNISSDPIVKKNLAIKRAQLKSAEDISFPERNEKKYEESEKWVLKSQSKAYLSHRALNLHTKRASKYAVVLYRKMGDKLIPTRKKQIKTSVCGDVNLSDKQVESDIISFSLNAKVDRLSPSLNLTLPVTKNASGPVCGFLQTSTGMWSDEGCETIILEDGLVECHCNHLTNFAVLMSPAGMDIYSMDYQILSFITIIGCAISIICLIITLVTYALCWNYVKADRSVIHINLSVCLILSYIIFLAGIDRICLEDVCTVIAAILHYVLLSAFFLMLCEGIVILLSVSIVFSRKSVLMKLLLLSYGAPALIVIIALSATEVQGYRSEKYCWLSIETGTLWAFVGPAFMIILVNTIIAAIVLKVMAGTAMLRNRESAEKAKSMMKALMVLTPLLGICWLFGILAVNSHTTIFQYLFAICNSLQGLFIFIFHCLLSRQVQEGVTNLYRRMRVRFGGHTQSTSSQGTLGRSENRGEMMALKNSKDY